VRVLVATTGGTGHIHPVVPLARALVSRGLDVTWATAEESCGMVERYGFATAPAGIAPPERIARFSERHPEAFSLPPPARRPVLFAGHFAEIAAPLMARDLAPVLDRFAPDLVVHDVAELASAPLAEARGLRHVAVAFSGELPPALCEAAIDGVAPLWAAAGRQVPGDLGTYAHAYLHPFPPSLGQRPGAPTVHDMCPLGADGSAGGEPPPWLAGMGRDRPLVYVTFGTEMGALAPWPALLGALGQADVDAVVTVGGGIDPATLAPMLDSEGARRVRIERYVPQSLVLARAGAVISHGGAGTMLAAAAAGLPQLAIPIGADQFDNAAAFSAAGSALTLGRETADEPGVAAALADLLGDPAVRRRAAVLAAELRAMPQPDDVVDVVVGA
jgi:UDP:flavonoid glycosyltransferase YjiC (YdhE family)